MKRWFITLYLLYLGIGLVYFLIRTLSDFNYVSLMAVISALSGSLYFTGIYTFNKTHNNLSFTKFYASGVYLSLGVALYLLGQNPVVAQYSALGFCAVHLLCWDRYINWYSKYPERDLQITKGKAMPSGVLYDTEGNRHKTADMNRADAVWLFFRGNWCPFCTAQIEQVAKEYRAIEKKGFRIYIVGNQPVEKSVKLEERLKFSRVFLTDPDHSYAKKTGLLDVGNLPLGLELFGYKKDLYYPALIIVKNGRVTDIELPSNYRDRPESRIILDRINAMNA